MEKRATDAGAGLGQVPGPEGGPVVAVEALGDAVGGDGIAEGVQELGGVLAEGEAGAGDEATVVVDDGAEDGAAPALLGADVWSVHEVGDPQIVRVRHFVLGAGSFGTTDGPVEIAGLEEAAQGGLADTQAAGQHAVLVQDLVEELDREFPVLDAVAGDDLGGVVVELAEAALVAPGPGQKGVEAASLVGAQPGT